MFISPNPTGHGTGAYSVTRYDSAIALLQESYEALKKQSQLFGYRLHIRLSCQHACSAWR